MFYEFKVMIKEEIARQYGTNKDFLSKNPNVKQSETALCMLLNPSSGATFGKIMPILQALKIEMKFYKGKKKLTM